MTNKEIAMLQRYMSTSRCYFEWGSGRSTEIACNMEIPKIYSVEADFKYFTKVREQCPRACINYVDINADNTSFCYPRDDSKKHNWRTYYHFVSLIDFTPDLVLIDGRFRVQCAHSAYSALDEDGVLLVHDYPKRVFYHDVELFFDVMAHVDTLYAFKKKPWKGSPHSDMYSILSNIDLKYEYDQR